MSKRIDGRALDEMRPIKITPHFTKHAEGSCLIECGDTKVICTASVEESVPPFLKGTGKGWVTAEYSMLPRATHTRSNRDINKLKLNGRSAEIQRLIGRSLRSVTNLDALGERSITIDCDVIQADVGTRTAAISGACVALVDALRSLQLNKSIKNDPFTQFIASTSVGIYKGEAVLDLDYPEDSNCETDMNVVMTQDGKFIEVQGTAEGVAFSRD